MPLNQTFTLPLQVIADQLTTSLGHPVAPKDIESIVYDGLAIPQPTATVNLKLVRPNNFLKNREFATFTRSQVVNFYNNVSGNSISAASINNIRIDPDDPGSFAELTP